MKKLLASASLLALSSVAVSAADLPMKAPPMVAPIPVFSWTGCYVGAHVGGASQHDSFTQDNSINSSPFSSSGEGVGGGNTGTGTGAVAGGQIGCNYQDGNAVFGLEGEGYWSSLKTTTGWSATDTDGDFSNFTQTTKNKSDYTIAARVGIAFDRTLVYGKAGWAWGNFAFGSVFNEGCPTCTTFTDAVAANKTLNGLMLGAGIEHAFTPNWTVKLEYDFIDFGSSQANFTECVTGNTPPCSGPFGTAQFGVSQHVYKQVVKVGFNYLFSPWGAAPLVAKY
jgi:outer membrane immunogenic protein